MKQALFFSALIVGLNAFATSSDSSKMKSSSSDMKSEVKVSEINRNPQRFLNKTVMVTGEVEKMASDSKSFVLDGKGAMNDQILVINKGGSMSGSASGSTGSDSADTNMAGSTAGTTSGVNSSTTAATGASSNSLKEEDEVQLSGTVRRLDVNAIERAYNVQLDSELKDEMKGAIPVIVADAKTFQLMRAK